jgi:uncharacterized membrane protein
VIAQVTSAPKFVISGENALLLVILLVAVGIFVALFVCHTAGKVAESVGGSYTVWFIFTFLVFFPLGLLVTSIMYVVKVTAHEVQKASKERSLRGPTAAQWQQASVGPQVVPAPQVYPQMTAPPAQYQYPAAIAPALGVQQGGDFPSPAGGIGKCMSCGADNPASRVNCWRCDTPLVRGV